MGPQPLIEWTAGRPGFNPIRRSKPHLPFKPPQVSVWTEGSGQPCPTELRVCTRMRPGKCRSPRLIGAIGVVRRVPSVIRTPQG